MILEDSHETQEFYLQLRTLLPRTNLFSFSGLSLRRTVKNFWGFITQVKV